MTMFTTVWRFVVRPEVVAEFERRYGADGDWSALFRRADGYLGTELHRNVAVAHEYVTIDRWTDEAAYRRFLETYAADYAALDARCEALTTSEEHVGTRTTP
jgi:heme-degrading monooxygenase HmoA